jgi:hypothetical protein
VALADAVREGRDSVRVSRPAHGFSDATAPAHTMPAQAPVVSSAPHPANGRRRGHLRVLPDPTD